MKSYTAREFMKDGRMFHIFRADTKNQLDRQSDEHTHDFIEIVYLLRGSGSHEIGDVTYTMFPGCLYIVDSGEVHNLNFHETSEYYNLFVKEDFL